MQASSSLYCGLSPCVLMYCRLSSKPKTKGMLQLICFCVSTSISIIMYCIFQLLSHVPLFVTQWTANTRLPCPSLSPRACSDSCHPTISFSVILLLLPLIFPSIGVFSNESVLCIRWPKYWSFNFSISPSNEHPGLISFRMDGLDLLAVQGILKSSPIPQFKSINILVLSFLHSPNLISIHDQWKNHSLE